MNLVCPKCRKTLPGCNGQTAAPGDTVECGLCGHIWQLRGGATAKLPSATVGSAASEGVAAALPINASNGESSDGATHQKGQDAGR